MISDVLLVHSPLVGPSVWQPVARLLEADGVRVACPDLRPALDAPEGARGSAFVDMAADGAVGSAVTVVGFSGAGVFLPAIAKALGERLACMAFLDAVVPPATGYHDMSDSFAAFIETQNVGGVLRAWSEWWPGEVDRMLPDPAMRAALAADMPQVLRSFYDEVVPMPAGWIEWPARYLQTSAAYTEDRELAESYDWPSATLDGTHLSLMTQPADVCSALVKLVD